MLYALWFISGMAFVYLFHKFAMLGTYDKKIVEIILRNIAKNNVPIADVGKMADKIDEFNAGEVDEELRNRIYAELKSLAMKNKGQVEDEVMFYKDVLDTMS